LYKVGSKSNYDKMEQKVTSDMYINITTYTHTHTHTHTLTENG